MNNYLFEQMATRKRFDKFEKIYGSLPDPDAILAENNYDYNILRDLINDPHLLATIQQRKMQVMQMGWEIDYEENEQIKSRIIELFRHLPLAEIMSDILDAIFYGFTVLEVMWEKKGTELIPCSIDGKPQEWFIFDESNRLRLRKRLNGFYVFEEGEILPDNKFIIAQYKPTYTNPYGQKVLSRCYWPVLLKRAGIDYWQLRMERYGMPYLIGRYPSSFTDDEKKEFLEQLHQMIEDNITIFEENLGIELKENAKFDIGQLYELFVEFQNKEISKAVLTVTLTTDVPKIGSYKAAEIHKDMLGFLGVCDKKLVEKGLNTLIEYFCKLNYGDIPTPRVKLNKKESVIDESAQRDKLLSEIGVKFSKDYFKKRYNLTDEDFSLVGSNE